MAKLPPGCVDFNGMGVREKAWACLLALENHWRLDVDRWAYSPTRDVVEVKRPVPRHEHEAERGSGHPVAQDKVGLELSETLREIERRFGDAARAEAELVSGLHAYTRREGR